MGSRIVIISKDPAITGIKEMLSTGGHRVFDTSNCEELINIIKNERPELAIIDAREFDYRDLYQRGKSLASDLDFILIASLDLQARIIHDLRMDIGGYLIPPFTRERVRMVLDRVLKQTELTRENRRLQMAMATAKAEWEATVDAIEDPIFIIDFEHRIKRANLAFYKNLNKGVAEVVGKPCFEVLEDIDRDRTESLCIKAKESGEPIHTDMELKRLGGKFRVSCYPIIYSGGGGFAFYLRRQG